MSENQTDPSDTATKRKRAVAEQEIALFAIGKGPDGSSETATRLQLPKTLDMSDPKNRSQAAIKRALKAAIESNEPWAAVYAGKRLRVAFLGQPFVCSTKVEEIKVVKVTVTDG